MMKNRLACLLPVLALLLISSVEGRADQFTLLENSPAIYWVPAPTPPPAYVAGQPAYYDGPGPYYYGPPPPRVIVAGPRFFFGFHFH